MVPRRQLDQALTRHRNKPAPPTSPPNLGEDVGKASIAAARRIGARPAVLFEGEHPFVLGPNAGAVDLQIVHPARAYHHGRRAWLSRMGRRPVAPPRDLLPGSGRRLIQAFAADAPADAVPLDQVLVRAGAKAPALMIPPGMKVRFAAQP